MPLFNNRWPVVSVLVSLGLQVAIIYTPVGRLLFGTVALGLGPWFILLGGLAVGFIAAVSVTPLVVRRL